LEWAGALGRASDRPWLKAGGTLIMERQEKAKVTPIGKPEAQGEALPYRIELWDADEPSRIERVLARAFNVPLAREIFKAAQKEHPHRRITLRRGARIIADSAG
jgi:hypothetical protein